ncbi:universal stress protein [Natronobacterium texcoconense]|uniref:Nucleotide-binding universal stress protein, UspA family n=1 Tax=Natronobacterium texcoconense TaxID=1095778 RepID=A0A1H1FRC4_NATTX|nr:universal stress protein [Natronobacterium texcoconense]SDR03440.1 Nucleotide-binding universal stress protein, UspA family [Natronobacterium texcoconense]
MYRVLLPVDTSEDRALAQAEYVSSLPEASEDVEAYILFVFQGDDEDLPDELEQFKSASRVGSVRRARERLEEAGIETTVLEDSGDAAADILDVAEEYDVDSIVLGGRKRSPVGKAMFGSVTQSVILNTDRPVAVTGSSGE